MHGNEVHPRTKKILVPVAPEFIPPAVQPKIEEPVTPQVSGKDIHVPSIETASLIDLIDAMARKKVENIQQLVDERVIEILKETIK